MTEHYVLLALFEGLTTVDPQTLDIRPGVAESWSISEDARTYTFFLDGSAAWSNGDPVTADDFVFSYQRILSPKLGAPYAYMLYCIEGAEAFHKGRTSDFASVGVRAINGRTLEIKLQSDPLFPFFAHAFYLVASAPTDHPQARGDDGSHFKVDAGETLCRKWPLCPQILAFKQRDRGTKMPLSTSGYSRSRRYPLPAHQFGNGGARLSCGTDPHHRVPTARIDWYRKNHPEQIRFDPYLGVYYYLVNTERAPLKDPRVRRALAYAIDRDTLTGYTLKGDKSQPITSRRRTRRLLCQ